MIVLGIETSCDETSAAVLDDSRVLSNVVSSQLVHVQYGGVVPELASRAHLRLLQPVVERALSEASIEKEQVEGIAVTCGPGLVGALLVGLTFAKGFSLSAGIPYIGVNHMEGHIYGNLLTVKDIAFPVLFLIVSGGHTQLVLMNDHLEYRIIGRTRDDAVGEAFDKSAKVMGLGYPGGPVIDKLARDGDASFVRFPQSFLKDDHFDFSYSGLKTAVLTYVEKHSPEHLEKHKADICASFQKAAIDVLISKTLRAADIHKVRAIAFAGGVAANGYLRQNLAEQGRDAGYDVYAPEMAYCTDNAAMIAYAGLHRLRRGERSAQNLNAVPSLTLGS